MYIYLLPTLAYVAYVAFSGHYKTNLTDRILYSMYLNSFKADSYRPNCIICIVNPQ